MLPYQLFALLILTIFELHAEEHNFRSIFRTPKRNYDDFEILERASFHAEGSESKTKDESPKATASAQIHVRIADKRSVKDGETVKSSGDVDDTLKKLLIMLIKPLVENNNGQGRINPFFPFPPSPHSSPPDSHLLGGLSALSALSGISNNNPEAIKKAAKIMHKFKEQLKASSTENEVEEIKREKTKNSEIIPLKITLNNKPLKLQTESFEENASVAEEVKKSEKLLDLSHLYPLFAKSDDDEEKPKRKKKKPKIKVVDPFDVYMRRILTPSLNFPENAPLCGLHERNLCSFNPYLRQCGVNFDLNSILAARGVNYDLNSILAPKIPPFLNPIPAIKPEILATEFVVHVPVLIKNKQPAYNNLVNYPLLSSLLGNYGKCAL